jgi:predicted amidohydrolase YtcJ
MQVSHTRVDPEFPLDPARFPGSVRPPASARLSREVLLRGYTIESARQMRRDDVMGSLTVGKAANLCVLSDDLFAAEAEAIKDIGVLLTLLDGEAVCGSIDTL